MDDSSPQPKALRSSLFRSVRSRLVFYFSLLFVLVLFSVESIGILGLPFFAYTGRRGQQKEAAFMILNLVADLKKDRLSNWFQHLRDDVRLLGSDPNFRTHAAKLSATIHRLTAEGVGGADLWETVSKLAHFRHLQERLDRFWNVKGNLDRIQIADLEGTVIVSTRATDLGAHLADRYAGARSQPTRGLTIEAVEEDENRDQLFIPIRYGITDNNNHVVAQLISEINFDNVLARLLRTYPGLGISSETLLVNRDLKVLTPLRYPLPTGTAAHPLEYRVTAEPAALAANGGEGTVESQDYRGEPVLAAYRFIPVTSEWGWGMVVKRDLHEVILPLRRDVTFTLLVALIGYLLLFICTSLLASRITAPIKLLSEAAHRVEKGDLQVRIPITTTDELSILGRTFNALIQRIQAWRQELEEAVENRTVELRKSNQELQREVRKRRQVEEALAESEYKYRTLVDHLPQMVSFKDTHLNYVAVNLKWAEEMGARPIEVVGKNDFDFLPAELAGKKMTQDQRILETGTPAETEESDLHDGRTRWLHTTRIPVQDKNDRLMGVLGIFTDITVRKSAERDLAAHREHLEEIVSDRTEELAQRVSEMEQLNRAMLNLLEDLRLNKESLELRTRQMQEINQELESFTHSVSHDLRAPLRHIAGFLSLLRKYAGAKLDKKSNRYVDIISDSVKHMDQLITDLLNLSRTGRVAMKGSTVHLVELARETIQNLKPEWQRRKIDWEIGDLPQVVADPSLMRLVLENLLSNALKFTRRCEKPRIEVGCSSKTEKEAVFYVRDNGAGFDMKYVHKLFGVFQRLHSSADYEGTGIGLANVQRIIHRHGGRVWAEGKESEGATFYFSLPRAGLTKEIA